MTPPCTLQGSEVIESFDNENIPVLNDELDSMDRSIRKIESSGLADFETPTADGVPVGDGTNFNTRVLPGCATEDTAKLLYDSSSDTFSCGIDSNDTNGVPVALRWGSIDAVTDDDTGRTTALNLLDTTPEEPLSDYIYWILSDDVAANIFQQEPIYWRKTSGINTISGSYSMWITITEGSRSGSCYVDVGSQVSTTSSSTSDVPATKTFSVDVSGLTNGTNYEIKLMCVDDVGGGNQTTVGVAKFIAFES